MTLSPITLDRITINPRYASFPDELTQNEWEQFGEKIDLVSDSVPFVIGDWVNYGISKYGATLKTIKGMIGEAESGKFSEKMKSFSEKTLFIYASVANKIPKEYRVDGVAFATHQAVSSVVPNRFANDEHRFQCYEEAKGWLLKAKEHRFTRKEMRSALANRSNLEEYLNDEKEPSDEFGEVIEVEPIQHTPSVTTEPTFSSMAISALRELNHIVAWFEKQEDPSKWKDDRKNAVYDQLKPAIMAADKVTDWYLRLAQ